MDKWVCLLCGHPVPIRLVYDFGRYSVRCCNECGLEFLHPQPTGADVGKLYSKHYFCSPDSQAQGYDSYLRDEAHILKTFRRRLLRLQNYFPDRSRRAVLDVGCAVGYFLLVAGESGWETKGVEVSASAAKEARQRFGLDVRTGTLETVDFPLGTFDLVTMWDVLEHLPDPKRELRRCAQLLKDKGYLALTTPDTEGFLRKVTGRNWVEYKKIPEHLHFFGKSTLRALLLQCGFTTLSIGAEGKYVGVPHLVKRMSKSHPLLTPLRVLLRVPALSELSLYVNATNTMMAVARKV